MGSPEQVVYEAALRVRDALTKLGCCYRTKAGQLVEISFRRLGVVGDRYGLLEVDVQRLPPRVTVRKLTHPETLHHLTAVVGRPVYVLNTTGVTYCVALEGTRRSTLPRRVRLDLDERPVGSYMIPIGMGGDGPVWRSLLETGHILLGGETRSGKSTWLNVMLVALLSAYGPDELRLVLVDPKGVELTPYAGLPHLAVPVADDLESATRALRWVELEMDQRREQFAGLFARDLATYNQRASERGEERLPLVLAVVDEVTDLAMQSGVRSPFFRSLVRVASKGAALGVVLVLATQHPKAEVLNTLVRENCSTRIAFRVSTASHSRVILGMRGAERLPRTVRGRMLARLGGGVEELQGFYVPDEEILALVERWRGDAGVQLSKLERELVRYAMEQLDGAFPLGRLYEAFKGRISYRRLVRLGQEWEHRGWLLPQRSAVDARRVSEVLVKLVGGVDGGKEKGDGA